MCFFSQFLSHMCLIIAVLFMEESSVPPDHPLLRNKRALRLNVPCVSNGEFYRNPNANPEKLWSLGECSKYYLCLAVLCLNMYSSSYIVLTNS
ncbi:hypothetical protein Pcinc_023703 [Petrolisthes cinctipes]|uniref:Secreted protein n=1 Tax=Petrolisthes cinctipes TaxID=88211 RepID=A0AAE1FCE9_PETCI|nr:hypothetical protein Pcinc_023703 [Petrolisthes cinctipes]